MQVHACRRHAEFPEISRTLRGHERLAFSTEEHRAAGREVDLVWHEGLRREKDWRLGSDSIRTDQASDLASCSAIRP
jgi:hypothetical protein